MGQETPRTRLLAVDDDQQILTLIREGLSDCDVDVLTAERPSEALRLFGEHRPQIVLSDLMMPEMGGMELMQKLLASDPAVEVILVSGYYTPEAAMEALDKGANDMLPKPLELRVLRERVEALDGVIRRRRRAAQLDHELVDTFCFQGIVGRSPLMIGVFDKVRRVAPHFRTVLVTGDTGTGKELAARALHQLSPRAAKQFAVCNCSAIAETLYESELFGYVKGAFTGAQQDKVGLFEFANGGTVFLDEIGDMPLAAQAKLLRVLQNQEIQRVGSPVARKVDVLVIAATNRDLTRMTQEEKFRQDLYYRLSMVEIKLPRLADRKEDLPLLEHFFLEKFAKQYGREIGGIKRRAQAAMARYNWPGNVRELENVIGNACMMVDGPLIDLEHLPERMRTPQAQPSAPDGDEPVLTMEEVQQRHLDRVLERVDGDKAQAAKLLGIGRATVYAMLARRESAKKQHAGAEN
jgi:DNA-binding NtrC family response regulator